MNASPTTEHLQARIDAMDAHLTIILRILEATTRTLDTMTKRIDRVENILLQHAGVER